MSLFESNSSIIPKIRKESDTGLSYDDHDNIEYRFMMDLRNNIEKMTNRIDDLEKKMTSIQSEGAKVDELLSSINRLCSISFIIQILLPLMIIGCACLIFWITKPDTILLKAVYAILGLIGTGVFIYTIRIPQKVKKIEEDIAELKNVKK